ncbi:hypothetical protein CATMIT_01834, partial [Catenibacterium mitsuokai DSM 15897]
GDHIVAVGIGAPARVAAVRRRGEHDHAVVEIAVGAVMPGGRGQRARPGGRAPGLVAAVLGGGEVQRGVPGAGAVGYAMARRQHMLRPDQGAGAADADAADMPVRVHGGVGDLYAIVGADDDFGRVQGIAIRRRQDRRGAERCRCAAYLFQVGDGLFEDGHVLGIHGRCVLRAVGRDHDRAQPGRLLPGREQACVDGCAGSGRRG